MKRQIHISGINMFFRCGEQFRRRYIEGEKIPPGISLIIGIATDESVTANLANVIQHEEFLPIEAVRDFARDSVENQFNADEVMLDEDERKEGKKKIKGRAIDSAVNLSVLHYKEAAPAIKPVAVQKQWVIEADGFPFDIAGTMDVQEKDFSIRDTKTSSKTPPKSVADTSDQLTMYALASWVIDKQMPPKVVLDYLIDLKNRKYKSFESVRTKKDFEYMLNRIEVFAEALEKEIFLPANSDNWICNPRWCGYALSCKYYRRRLS